MSEKSSKGRKKDDDREMDTQSHKAEVEKLVKDKNDGDVMEMVIDSPDKWEPASAIVTQYKVTRPDGKVLVFLLQGIPSTVYYQIMRETRPMDVPEKEVVPRDKRGNVVQGMAVTKEVDVKDAAYLANLEEMGNKKMTLVIDAALTFDIPGDKWQDKHEWLQERLPGDVMNLFNTIERFIFNLSEQFGNYL